MTPLSRSTLSRLKELPQHPATWEGGRRPQNPDLSESMGNCILWIDRSLGKVRAMDVVPSGILMEAMTRALLDAMRHPKFGQEPARPTRIYVNEREIQLYLRGVLKGLDILVEYDRTLPMCEEIFEEMYG